MPELDDKGDTEYWTNLLSVYRHSKKKVPPGGQTELIEIEQDTEQRTSRSKKASQMHGR